MSGALYLRSTISIATVAFARGLRNFTLRSQASFRKAERKKVYISYSQENSGFKKFLETWDEQSDFSFFFSEIPYDVPHEKERTVKAMLTRQMRRAEYFLLVVGEKTHEDPWARWQIIRAQELHLKTAAVKLSSHYIIPEELQKAEISWAAAFTKHSILSALIKSH